MNTTALIFQINQIVGTAVSRIWVGRTWWIAALCVMATVATSSALQSGDFTYTINTPDTNTVTITDYTGDDGEVTIPSTISGKSVTIIGRFAFSSCNSLTRITIPDSITTIGYSAFARCSSLVSITVGNHVAAIDRYVFLGCRQLISISVSTANAVYSSRNGVLFNKDGTTLVVCPGGKTGSFGIPDSVTSISDTAFSGCDQLTSVMIPDRVTTIGYAAFSGCFFLTSVTIPSSVTAIGNGAFYGCGNLFSISASVANDFYSSEDGVLFDKTGTALVAYPGGRTGIYEIPDSVTTIGYSAFSGGRLVGVTIGDSVTTIGVFAFNYCTRLANVTIGDNVASIGYAAFYACTSLTSITIGDGVTTIGYSAFAGCYSLTSISVNAANTFYSSVNGVLLNKVGSTLIACPGGKTGHYEILDGIATIGEGAFKHCTSLASVTIPDSVTSIENSAFYSCTILASVYCQGNAQILGSSVFSGASNASVYYMPGTIGWGATFGGRPTVLWNPVIQTDGENFGAQPAGFGFDISGTSNLTFVVEACTNLVDGAWMPVETNTLTGGISYFSDPDWINAPNRYYRVSML